MVKGEYAIYRPEYFYGKSHMIKLIESWTNYIYQEYLQLKYLQRKSISNCK